MEPDCKPSVIRFLETEGCGDKSEMGEYMRAVLSGYGGPPDGGDGELDYYNLDVCANLPVRSSDEEGGDDDEKRDADF